LLFDIGKIFNVIKGGFQNNLRKRTFQPKKIKIISYLLKYEMKMIEKLKRKNLVDHRLSRVLNEWIAS